MMPNTASAHASSLNAPPLNGFYKQVSSKLNVAGGLLVKRDISYSVANTNKQISLDDTGTLSIGENFRINVRSRRQLTGKHVPTVSGGEATIAKNKHADVSIKAEEGYAGPEFSTTWTISGPKSNPWIATISVKLFIGKPVPKPNPPWWKGIPVVGAALGALTKWLAGTVTEVLNDSPEWGEDFAEGLAAAGA